ncbi:hypothetical protein HPP92_017893 [Vanilla planifolia]|uniref:Uncharacterized protein n=1 Tax=Vanilla planifolia TaxID=51239 RepID=A0A835Q5S1_VANPL|nr:hypothetical protein HPP92_018460 [Vanilla planifolia]KAG0468565.1 hypothetical protein HPP92_017893 [Vanilla planifolia]
MDAWLSARNSGVGLLHGLTRGKGRMGRGKGKGKRSEEESAESCIWVLFLLVVWKDGSAARFDFGIFLGINAVGERFADMKGGRWQDLGQLRLKTTAWIHLFVSFLRVPSALLGGGAFTELGLLS